MPSDTDFVSYVVDQMGGPEAITYKKMFGEYAIYSEKKVVALVCNNQLFVKPTIGGRSYIGNVNEVPAYQGAKQSFLIDERFDDKEWLSKLIQITTRELPEPKPKKK